MNQELIATLSKSARAYIDSLTLPKNYQSIYYVQLFDKINLKLLYHKVGKSINLSTRMHNYNAKYAVRIMRLYFVTNADAAEWYIHKQLKENGYIISHGDEYYTIENNEQPNGEHIEKFISIIREAVNNWYLNEIIPEESDELKNAPDIKRTRTLSDDEIINLFTRYVELYRDEYGNIPYINTKDKIRIDGFVLRSFIDELIYKPPNKRQSINPELATVISNILEYDILTTTRTRKHVKKSTMENFNLITSWIKENNGKMIPWASNEAYHGKSLKSLSQQFNRAMRGDYNRWLTQKYLDFMLDHEYILLYKSFTIDDEVKHKNDCRAYMRSLIVKEFYEKYKRKPKTSKGQKIYWDAWEDKIIDEDQYDEMNPNILIIDEYDLYWYIKNILDKKNNIIYYDIIEPLYGKLFN